MKLSRFRLLAGFFILALVLVDVAARPTSLQDSAVLPAKNGRNLEDNSPLALDRREDLTSRSSTGPDHPQSPDTEAPSLPLHPLNARAPRFDPESIKLMNAIFFEPNLISLIDKVARLALGQRGGTPPRNVERIRNLAQGLRRSYINLYFEYMILSTHYENSDRLGQDLNLYAVDLTAHPKYFKTLTDEICWTPDVKYHHQRKRRDVLFESLEQPKAKTLLPELDQWAKGHGYPGISDLITLFFRTLEEFCEANYAWYGMPPREFSFI